MSGAEKLLGFDPTDPVQVAVKVTRLEEGMLRSQDAFNTTAEALREGMDGMRGDLRGVAEQLKELPRLAHSQQNQDNGLGRAFKAIENLANETRKSFENRDGTMNQWCRDYEDERDRWRTSHEEDNRNTREQLIRWNGIGVGISILSTALVGTILYIYAGDKAAMRETIAKMEAREETAHAAINARVERNSGRVGEVERYLTQEGTVDGRPYVPSQPR